jgi:activator of HSP90 ATPase
MSRRRILSGAVMAAGAIGFGGIPAWTTNGDGSGISRSAEAIHQEPVIKANRRRVYEALTDGAQFHKVTMLGVAMRSGTAKDAKPTEISREVGGAFQLFGGFIVGRQIELVPDLRIVQAWREVTWDPGVYSIVRFELSEQGEETKIAFDHTGFPQGAADHLAIGWKGNYWDPLEKFLTT